MLANTGGVPLAFAFIASIGNSGVITDLLAHLGFNPYNHGFNTFLRVGARHRKFVLSAPTHHSLDAAARRGVAARMARGRLHARGVDSCWPTGERLSDRLQVVAMPFMVMLMVLFMDAFAAYATADVLTTGVVPLVPLAIGQFLAGNEVADQVHLGDALGFGMVVIVVVAGALYAVVQRRTSRWLR